jgi:hypothetical protein
MTAVSKTKKSRRVSPASKAKKKRKDSPKGITRISIRGYKSIVEECSIEIRPLTILAGANSSGKSSVMQPLLLMKQTLEATYDPGALLLHGPNVRFTDADQLFSNMPGQPKSRTFAISVDSDMSQLSLIFKKPARKDLEVAEMTYKTKKEATTLRPNMSHPEIASMLPKDLRAFLKEVAEDSEQPIEWRVGRDRCFLDIRPFSARKRRKAFLPLRISPVGWFERYAREVIHVPGLRGNPERSYKTIPIGDSFQGTFEAYVASIISHWQKNKDNRIRDLAHDLNLLELTWLVLAKRTDDTNVELDIGRLASRKRGGARDVVNIADVGFGVSQVLPVLVALLAAEPGQIVFLEQPEIHLHPRAQVALAEVLVRAAKRGVRVVAETHSALLLLALQTLVAKRSVSPQLIKLHWFTRRPGDGVTEVTSTELDESGAFGDWPEDFADVAIAAEQEYLDAAESRGRAR